MHRGEGRIGYVDGLRAIAVLAVVISHVGKHSLVSPASPLGFVLRQGAHGVDLFFVLSGFCLAYPSLSRRAGAAISFDVFRYAAHRLVRIVPPYYAAIVALTVFSLAIGKTVHFDNVVKYALFDDIQLPQLNNSFWTLPVEFRWYFLFPVVLYVWTHSRRAFTALFLAVVATAFTRAWSSDLGTLPAFMLGIVAADAYVRSPRIARYAWMFFLVLFVLDARSGVAEWGDDFGIRWYLAFFALTVAGGANGVFRAILEHPAARFIGTASYSIYLVHEPVIAYLESRHVPMAVAGLAGVAAGVVFWAAVERAFTRGALRERLVAASERALAVVLGRAGVPRSIQLGASPAPAFEIPAAAPVSTRAAVRSTAVS